MLQDPPVARPHLKVVQLWVFHALRSVHDTSPIAASERGKTRRWHRWDQVAKGAERAVHRFCGGGYLRYPKPGHHLEKPGARQAKPPRRCTAIAAFRRQRGGDHAPFQVRHGLGRGCCGTCAHVFRCSSVSVAGKSEVIWADEAASRAARKSRASHRRLSNSRTLPGQSCAVSQASASGKKRKRGPSPCRKRTASGAISSRRAESGNVRNTIPRKR